MNPSRLPNPGLYYAALAALFYAVFNVVLRFVEPHATVWQVIFGRSLFGLICVTLIARQQGIELTGKNRKLLLLNGLIATTSFTCLVAALLLVPIFEALALLYLFPAFAAFFSPRITGERMGGVEWFCIATSFVGTLLIIWPGHLNDSLEWGHLAGLAAGLLYGLTITVTRKLRAVNNALTPFFYISAVGTVACTAILLNLPGGFAMDLPGWTGIIILALLAAGAQLSSNKALGTLASAKVGVINMLEVPIGMVAGYFILGEAIGGRALSGAAFILGGALLLNFKPLVPFIKISGQKEFSTGARLRANPTVK